MFKYRREMDTRTLSPTSWNLDLRKMKFDCGRWWRSANVKVTERVERHEEISFAPVCLTFSRGRP